MAQRTSTAAVQTILGDNYGALVSGSLPSLQPYVDTATVMVDRVVTCAASKGISLSTAEQEIVERWLSAYYYTKMDPLYSSRSTAGASGAFVAGAEPERYKAAAIEVDPSGCLKALLNKTMVQAMWLGKTDNEKLDYDARN